MGKICAPVRDEQIKKLANMTEVVSVFRGIMEVGGIREKPWYSLILSKYRDFSKSFFQTLELMTLDMANFSIGVIKPDIVAASVEYEKKHFKNLLETQPGMERLI